MEKEKNLKIDYHFKMSTEDIKWHNWLKENGHIFLDLPFPKAAFIDRVHFECFIEGYTDILKEHKELCSFELNNLSDQEAMKVLIALEDYVCHPLDTWMLIELRKRFNLPCQFEDDGETWPVIPPHLITEILVES